MTDRYFLIDPDGATVGSVTAADFRNKKTVLTRDGRAATYQDAGYRLGGNEITNEPYAEPAPKAADATAPREKADARKGTD